jgi:hypothetical protein
MGSVPSRKWKPIFKNRYIKVLHEPFVFQLLCKIIYSFSSFRLYRSYVQHTHRSSQPAGLRLALNRFDQSHTRESGEDMVVDLTIALESTLLAGVEGSSVTNLRFGARHYLLRADPTKDV